MHVAHLLLIAMSAYRLGDIFYQQTNREDLADMISVHPDTIAGAITRAHGYGEVWGSPFNPHVLSRAASLQCPRYAVPSDMNESIAIHLRVGDVVCGVDGHEQGKRPLPAKWYSKLSTGRVYVFGVPYHTNSSSRICNNESYAYVRAVLGYTKGSLYPSSSADGDVCAMRVAKNFVQGMGFFSKTVAALRVYKGRLVTRPSHDHLHNR